MEIDSSLAQMFQEQLSREYYNAAAYNELAGVLESAAWDGFAKWMRKAASEELEHYKKFNDFLVDRNVIPVLSSVPQAPSGSGDPYMAFQIAMSLEKENTAKIIALDEACENVGDCDAEYWLIWALEEQRKAERELTDILLWLSRAGTDNAALLILDEKLGS